MCTVLLPPGVNPIAVNKYIISYIVSYINSDGMGVACETYGEKGSCIGFDGES
jgi:hypothetical protein